MPTNRVITFATTIDSLAAVIVVMASTLPAHIIVSGVRGYSYKYVTPVNHLNYYNISKRPNYRLRCSYVTVFLNRWLLNDANGHRSIADQWYLAYNSWKRSHSAAPHSRIGHGKTHDTSPDTLGLSA